MQAIEEVIILLLFLLFQRCFFLNSLKEIKLYFKKIQKSSTLKDRNKTNKLVFFSEANLISSGLESSPACYTNRQASFLLQRYEEHSTASWLVQA